MLLFALVRLMKLWNWFPVKLNIYFGEIPKYRKELNAYLDKREKDLLDRSKAGDTEDQTTLRNLRDDIISLKTDIEENKLVSQQNENSNLLVVSKPILEQMPEYKCCLTEYTSQIKTLEYRCVRDAVHVV